VSARVLGLSIAAVCLIADQAHKLWMLFVYDIAARQPVHVAPFLDLVMAWNPGISYSLFAAGGGNCDRLGGRTRGGRSR